MGTAMTSSLVHKSPRGVTVTRGGSEGGRRSTPAAPIVLNVPFVERSFVEGTSTNHERAFVVNPLVRIEFCTSPRPRYVRTFVRPPPATSPSASPALRNVSSTRSAMAISKATDRPPATEFLTLIGPSPPAAATRLRRCARSATSGPRSLLHRHSAPQHAPPARLPRRDPTKPAHRECSNDPLWRVDSRVPWSMSLVATWPAAPRAGSV